MVTSLRKGRNSGKLMATGSSGTACPRPKRGPEPPYRSCVCAARSRHAGISSADVGRSGAKERHGAPSAYIHGAPSAYMGMIDLRAALVQTEYASQPAPFR